MFLLAFVVLGFCAVVVAVLVGFVLGFSGGVSAREGVGGALGWEGVWVGSTVLVLTVVVLAWEEVEGGWGEGCQGHTPCLCLNKIGEL